MASVPFFCCLFQPFYTRPNQIPDHQSSFPKRGWCRSNKPPQLPIPNSQLPSSKEGCPPGRGGIEVITHHNSQLPSSKEGCPSGRGGIEVITHRQVEQHFIITQCFNHNLLFSSHHQVEHHKKTRARSCVYNQEQKQRLVFITRNKSRDLCL